MAKNTHTQQRRQYKTMMIMVMMMMMIVIIIIIIIIFYLWTTVRMAAHLMLGMKWMNIRKKTSMQPKITNKTSSNRRNEYNSLHVRIIAVCCAAPHRSSFNIYINTYAIENAINYTGAITRTHTHTHMRMQRHSMKKNKASKHWIHLNNCISLMRWSIYALRTRTHTHTGNHFSFQRRY